MAFWKRQKYRDTETYERLRSIEKADHWPGEAQGMFKGGENILYGNDVVDIWCYIFVKTHRTLQKKEWILIHAN